MERITIMLRIILIFSVISIFILISTSESKAGVAGACCTNLPEDDCSVETESECDGASDFFLSPGLPCSPNPCILDPDSTQDCCVEQSSTTGCNDSGCESIVCDEDPFCCFFEWDAQCVGEAEELCGTLCGGSGGPVVIVPTMGQWGMIFASIILGLIGIFALIREKKINQYLD